MSNQKGWHKFDEGDGMSSSPSKTNSSGVSSARGSVNSLSTSENPLQNGNGEPGALEVTEIHVCKIEI